MPPQSQRERDAAKRQEKLDHIDRQVADGSLVVRQMTEEERAKWAPKPDSERPKPRRRASS